MITNTQTDADGRRRTQTDADGRRPVGGFCVVGA